MMNSDSDFDSDSKITPAMDRLRAADPAKDAPPLHLTAGDVRSQQSDIETVDERSLPSAGGTRRRRGRTPWWLAAAAVIVILGVVGALVVQQVRNTSEAPILGAPASPPAALGCDAPVEPTDSLPSGAVAVRLCDAPAQADNPSAIAPPDALTHRIDELIAVYNGLDRMPAGPICTQELGLRYELVFTYDGRDPVRISGELYGCRAVGDRTGSEKVLDSFSGLLRAQRADTGPWTEEVDGPGCPERLSHLVPHPDELANGAAVLCRLNDQGVPDRMVTIASEDWQTLQADLVRNAEEAEFAETCGEPPRFLGAINSYGEQVTITLHCNVGWWQPNIRSDTWMRWQVSPAAFEIINRLAGG